jgi:hypothetical protein
MISLLGMPQFGRDAWRSRGEVCSVCFGTGASRPVRSRGDRRRGKLDGSFPGRPRDRALGPLVGRARFTRRWLDLCDGRSQTQAFLDLMGVPDLARASMFPAGLLVLVPGVALALVAHAAGVALGFSAADPLVGLLIVGVILFVARDALLGIGGRMMDVFDPALIERLEVAARPPGGGARQDVRARRVVTLAAPTPTSSWTMTAGPLRARRSRRPSGMRSCTPSRSSGWRPCT